MVDGYGCMVRGRCDEPRDVEQLGAACGVSVFGKVPRGAVRLRPSALRCLPSSKVPSPKPATDHAASMQGEGGGRLTLHDGDTMRRRRSCGRERIEGGRRTLSPRGVTVAEAGRDGLTKQKDVRCKKKGKKKKTLTNSRQTPPTREEEERSVVRVQVQAGPSRGQLRKQRQPIRTLSMVHCPLADDPCERGRKERAPLSRAPSLSVSPCRACDLWGSGRRRRREVEGTCCSSRE
jgi:hypothetical protein